MLDFDNGPLIDVMKERLKNKNYSYSLITSKSHTDDKHKYHLHLYLNHPIYSKKTYKHTLENLIENDFPEADRACTDLARFFFGSKEDSIYHENIISEHALSKIDAI